MAAVDKLTRTSYFILVKSTSKDINLNEVFMKETFMLHNISKTTIFDRDVEFTSKFWKALFKGMDTQLNFNTAHHPQTYGQTERTNQILEEMLCMYVMNIAK